MTDILIDNVFWAARAVAESLWGLIFIQDSVNRLHFVYLLSFVGISVFLWIWGKPKSSSLFEFLVPKRVYTDVSFLVDLKVYLLNGLLSSAVNLGTVVSSTVVVAGLVTEQLPELFGRSNLGIAPDNVSTILFSAAFVLLTDFGLFFAHYIAHKVPFFWAFHKVHHSAEVLTPVTAFRFHPIDTILNGTVVSVCVGPLIGAYQFIYSGDLPTRTPLMYVCVLVAWLMTANFRHSHISLHYPKTVSRWLVSPAMHNLHHSSNPIHFDKNLGFFFSIWDRMAGMYFLPERNVSLDFGIGAGEETQYRSLGNCYLLPIKQVSTMLVNATKRIRSAVS